MWDTEGNAVAVPSSFKNKPGRKRIPRAQEIALQVEHSGETNDTIIELFGTLEHRLWRGGPLPPENFQEFTKNCSYDKCNYADYQTMAMQIRDILIKSRRHADIQPVVVSDIPWGLRAKLFFDANGYELNPADLIDEEGVIHTDDLEKLFYAEQDFLRIAEMLYPKADAPRSQPLVGDHTWQTRQPVRDIVETK